MADDATAVAPNATDHVMKFIDRVLPGSLQTANEAILDGWGVAEDTDISPAMLATALENEARTQDQCVKDGVSDPSFPTSLRLAAARILLVEHERLMAEVEGKPVYPDMAFDPNVKAAAVLFDGITGASYYGMAFRAALSNDEQARNAAVLLVARLKKYQVPGVE